MAKGKGKSTGTYGRRESKVEVNGKRAIKKFEKKSKKADAKEKPQRKKFVGHDKGPRKEEIKRKLEVARIQRAIAKHEDVMHNYHPPIEQEPLDPTKKRKRKRLDFYELDTSNWKLTGAARPAPTIGAEPFNPHAPGPQGVDVFELKGKAFCSHPCGQEYLKLTCSLAHAMHDGLHHSKDGAVNYRKCIELDPEDKVGARRGLVRALLDLSLADQARAVMEAYPNDKGTEFSWSLVAIEYIAWKLLDEEGSSEEVALKALEEAYTSNPFVAWYLANAPIFEEVVEHVEEITNPEEGTVEEAFRYCRWEEGLWADLDEVSEWIASFIYDRELPHPTLKGGNDPEHGDMFVRMFETAVSMAEDAAAALVEEEGEQEGEGSGSEDEEAPELEEVNDSRRNSSSGGSASAADDDDHALSSSGDEG